MKAGEAVKAVMKEQGVGVNRLADRTGNNQSTISERLRYSNISIARLNEMLRVLDYRIVIMPRDVTIPKGGYEIE